MKKDGKFQNITKPEPIDWCLMVAGKLKPHIFVKIGIEVMKKLSPEFFHSCPYVGLQNVSSSIPRQFLAFYATGVYKQKTEIFDGQDKIFSCEIVFTTS
jgi:hypothetical protein